MRQRELMGYLVFEAIKLHPDIKEIVKYTERAIVTQQILAAVFEVDEVLIGKVIRRHLERRRGGCVRGCLGQGRAVVLPGEPAV